MVFSVFKGIGEPRPDLERPAAVCKPSQWRTVKARFCQSQRVIENKTLPLHSSVRMETHPAHECGPIPDGRWQPNKQRRSERSRRSGGWRDDHDMNLKERSRTDERWYRRQSWDGFRIAAGEEKAVVSLPHPPPFLLGQLLPDAPSRPFSGWIVRACRV